DRWSTPGRRRASTPTGGSPGSAWPTASPPAPRATPTARPSWSTSCAAPAARSASAPSRRSRCTSTGASGWSVPCPPRSRTTRPTWRECWRRLRRARPRPRSSASSRTRRRGRTSRPRAWRGAGRRSGAPRRGASRVEHEVEDGEPAGGRVRHLHDEPRVEDPVALVPGLAGEIELGGDGRPTRRLHLDVDVAGAAGGHAPRDGLDAGAPPPPRRPLAAPPRAPPGVAPPPLPPPHAPAPPPAPP